MEEGYKHNVTVCECVHFKTCEDVIVGISTGFQSLTGVPQSVYRGTITHTFECVGDLLLCLDETSTCITFPLAGRLM